VNSRPIRVVFVVPDLHTGGAERHVTTLLPRMDPARFTPSVVCIGDEGDLFNALSAAGIEACALGLSKRSALRALSELVTIFRRARPDVVVVRGYSAEALGRIAARLAGVAHTVMWVHNIADITPRGRVRVALDRALDRWTSAYFGVAEGQRPYLVDSLRYPDAKIRIVLNGVDPSLFDTGTDRSVLREFGWGEDDPVVGIVAGLRPEKDHATLLRAAPIVIEHLPRARFLIIGDGPMRPRLESLVAELGIASSVHFAGARPDVTRLLRGIDVFTLSSETECFSIALLEAMASARPAVCTAVGGTPEIIADGQSGYLVPLKDSQRLADRLLDLLSNPQAARRMGQVGRARIETEFDLRRSVDAAELALEEVVGGILATSERSQR
jgi:glycosyltransferase involved in cell wall biosynthesis